ncbi:hypothetical protein IQ22_04292 [Pseudomonas duriflava]|uniref:Uncharacterized protein n=1 Tax=Pseudomonas duriflava TaxID=459528 RepID=A0A562PUE0_9PSED|nr:hypothetical protein [Pseudomonas duriflava]TWI47780.1 hypothetical protein IQ22_04292 [Pseudomonas duriflava]
MKWPFTKNKQDQVKKTEVELPKGVFPPMPGYTNGDLIAAACKRVEKLMKEEEIDPTLARESLFALADHLNQAFETENVEYQVSTWYQKPYDTPSGRVESVSSMAESFGALAIRAAGASLAGSPLLHKGKQFWGPYIKAAGDGVSDLIITLNEPRS